VKRAHPLVLAVSDRTLLPVVLRARDLRTMVPRLARQFERVARAIGAPREAIVREVAAMGEATVLRTASRQVLGCMTEFAFMTAAYTKGHLVTDDALVELAVWLAEAPCRLIGMERPRDAALAALTRGVAPTLA